MHVWAGCVVAVAVVIRTLWGFVGPHGARFSDFIYSPRAVLAYLNDPVRLRAVRLVGHSPAGGAMVVPPNEAPLCPTIFSHAGQLEWVATCESSTNRTYQDSLLFAGLNVLDPYLSISHRICEAPPPRSIRRVLPHRPPGGETGKHWVFGDHNNR